MAIHRIYIPTVLETGALTISGDEAQHAIRVKRLREGDSVELLDGQGRLGPALVVRTAKDREGWRLDVDVLDVQIVPPLRPRLEVFAPTPKGPRLSEMIDGLSQVGAATWSPLFTALSISDAKPTKLDRMQRIAAEASKQCGRAWLLEVGQGITLKNALAAHEGATIVMADESGRPYTRTAAQTVQILIGPEGGWRPDELALAAKRNIQLARFGPYTMRIETAAVVAAAVVLDAEQRQS